MLPNREKSWYTFTLTPVAEGTTKVKVRVIDDKTEVILSELILRSEVQIGDSFETSYGVVATEIPVRALCQPGSAPSETLPGQHPARLPDGARDVVVASQRAASTFSRLGASLIALVLVFAVLWAHQYHRATTFLAESKASVQQGKLEQALVYADMALEKAPSAVAYGQRGITEKLLGKAQNALSDFSKATSLDPTYAWAYAQIADIYSKSDDQEKALENVNKALSVDPRFVEAYRLRAQIYSRMGECENAYEDLQKSQSLKPDAAVIYQDKARVLLGCPTDGIRDASKALELAQKAAKLSDGKDYAVLETLAEAYFRQGNPDKAVEYQRRAIDLGSQQCKGESCLKEMRQTLSDYEMAARQEKRSGYEILSPDTGP